MAARAGAALHSPRAQERDRQAPRTPSRGDQGARWWRIFDEARSAGEARQQLQALISEYRAAYPSAMDVIERDLPALVTHLRFPSEHRKRIRTTNLLERTFVEVRRRTKVIGRFPGEISARCRSSGPSWSSPHAAGAA